MLHPSQGLGPCLLFTFYPTHPPIPPPNNAGCPCRAPARVLWPSLLLTFYPTHPPTHPTPHCRLPMPRPGQVLGLVGSNGTGKSTALKILAGKLKPNLGRFNVRGDSFECFTLEGTFFPGWQAQAQPGAVQREGPFLLVFLRRGLARLCLVGKLKPHLWRFDVSTGLCLLCGVRAHARVFVCAFMHTRVGILSCVDDSHLSHMPCFIPPLPLPLQSPPAWAEILTYFRGSLPSHAR